MTATIVLLFAAPLLAAAVGTLAWRHRAIQRAISVTTLGAAIALVVGFVDATRDGTVLAARVGSWPTGLAIVVAIDGLASLVLTVMLVMASVSLVLAMLRDEDSHPLLHPLAMVLVAGISLALITTDLFNLFVSFEVLLIASYVLLTLRSGGQQVRAGVIYVSVNILASTLLLLGVGLLYAATGTVEMARLASVVPGDPAAIAALSLVVVAVATKAALVPLHGWLPRAYVHASPAVTALFSALLTKVGVYVLYRLTSLVLADVPGWQPLMLVVAALTMVVGVLGALGGSDIRGILSFHMISQVGYIIVPLGIWSVASAGGGIFYLLHNMVAKGTLFLVAGVIESHTGTGRLDRLSGLARRHPWLMAGFLVPAFALAGLPPTTGFVSKYLVVLSAFRADAWPIGAIAILVSLFTLMSMVKILDGAFWGEPNALVADSDAAPSARLPLMVALPVMMAIVIAVVSVTSGWLVDLTASAARGLVDPTAYIAAVTGA